MRTVVLLAIFGVILAGALGLGGCMTGRGGRPRPLPQGQWPIRPIEVPAAAFEPDAMLLLTGGTQGRLEMCNCAGVMSGGLARRGGLLASYRARYPAALTIDTGDLFWIEPDANRHSHLLRGLDMLGYDVLALGDAEWATAPVDLANLLADRSMRILASNVRYEGASLHPGRSVVIPAGGHEIALLNYVGDDAFLFVDDPTAGGRLRDGVDSLRPIVDEHDRAGRVVVLIVHDSMDTAERLAGELSGVDLVIRGNTDRALGEVRRVEGVPVVQIGGPENVGVLGMRFDAGRIAELQWRVELLDDRWPADQRMLDLYQSYAHVAMRNALDADRAEGLRYEASRTCGECHKWEYWQWQRTAHAHAWQTLEEVERIGDPDCMACHVSGFGSRRGFYSIDRTPGLGNVNCQDCHRHDIEDHIDEHDQRIESFEIPAPDEKVCQSCHTPMNSPEFEYQQYRREILGLGHGD